MGIFTNIFNKPQTKKSITSLTQLLDDAGRIPTSTIEQIESGTIKGFNAVKSPIGYNVSRVNPKTGTEVIFKLDRHGTLMEKNITLGSNNFANFAYKKHRTLYERVFNNTTKAQVGVRPTHIYSDFKCPIAPDANGARFCRTYTNNGWQVSKTTPMNF